MTTAENKPNGVADLVYDISFVVDDEMRELRMTFGLLNLLMQKVGNYGNVAMVGVDPVVNDILLRTLLVKRDHKGKPEPVVVDVDGAAVTRPGPQMLDDIYEVDVSPADCEALLFFAQSHMADFSLRTLTRAATFNKTNRPAAELLSSLTRGLLGQQAEASKNSSALPSTPPSPN